MKNWLYSLIFFLLGLTFLQATLVSAPESRTEESLTCSSQDWGFFGHRRINRMAVFTLPPEMMVFYKKNIEFITDHAVDPDKRRYATRHEGVRHYIDIDQWGTYPFDNVPRNWTDALLKYAELNYINSKSDTIAVLDFKQEIKEGKTIKINPAFQQKYQTVPEIDYQRYRNFFSNNILSQYYEDEWPVELDSLENLLGRDFDEGDVFVVDKFSEHGILPYHLYEMQKRLTRAFENRNSERILRLSTEFGHYIGDAHVPLHTTTNYNGQLTDQVGIHGFWESRIPELFADKEFDFFVGKADYIDQPKAYFWDIVLTSHLYVDSVLLIEKSLSKTFPEDQQYCYDDRGEATIRTYCKAYAAAFNRRMDGMVEARMRASIKTIGNVWYTAWVDAGQPDLSQFLAKPGKNKEDEALNAAVRKGQIKGREHGN